MLSESTPVSGSKKQDFLKHIYITVKDLTYVILLLGAQVNFALVLTDGKESGSRDAIESGLRPDRMNRHNTGNP